MAKGPVLVVDDDQDIQYSMEMALADEGYEVLTASDGAEALTVLQRHVPKLILLDMRMPVMDGWQFAEAYRRRPGPHAPIVVVTAARDAAARAAEIEAQGVLPKPFRIDDLLHMVDQYAQT
jgi:CheY-like chemotaxis protein